MMGPVVGFPNNGGALEVWQGRAPPRPAARPRPRGGARGAAAPARCARGIAVCSRFISAPRPVTPGRGFGPLALAGAALRAAMPPFAPAPGLRSPVPRGPGAPPGAAPCGALGPARALCGGARPVPPGLGSPPCPALGSGRRCGARRSSPAPCPARPRFGPPRVPLPRPALRRLRPSVLPPGGGGRPGAALVRRSPPPGVWGSVFHISINWKERFCDVPPKRDVQNHAFR